MTKNRTIPFGYAIINGEIQIKNSEAEAVRKIFVDYLDGNSLKAIAAKMTVPYNESKPHWNKNMVCRVIENPRYIGENGFPKIIDSNIFEQAQEIKRERCSYKNPVKVEEKAVPETSKYSYQPTEEIKTLTSEISRMTDTDKLRELAYKLAKIKYSAIVEERSAENAG